MLVHSNAKTSTLELQREDSQQCSTVLHNAAEPFWTLLLTPWHHNAPAHQKCIATCLLCSIKIYISNENLVDTELLGMGLTELKNSQMNAKLPLPQYMLGESLPGPSIKWSGL